MAIVLKNVSYGNVLKKVNLNISEKLIVGIMGNSGSGKTTLAEILDMLIFPDDGMYKINDEEVNESNYRNFKSKVGMVFQFPEEQFFCNTVEKEIEFGLNYLNKDLDYIKKRVYDSLIMVGLDASYLDRNPFTLSSGEKRKVAIASILAINPEIIIFDEPTLGLDSISKKSLIRILKLLKTRYDKTIIVFSRDSELIHNMCDQVFVLHNGKIVLKGNKYEVFSKDVSKYGLKRPKILEFEQIVLDKKNVKLIYRDDINDLMKDVYRSVK